MDCIIGCEKFGVSLPYPIQAPSPRKNLRKRNVLLYTVSFVFTAVEVSLLSIALIYSSALAQVVSCNQLRTLMNSAIPRGLYFDNSTGRVTLQSGAIEFKD